MKNYIIRDMDPGLWVRVKTRAAADDRPLRSIILALLEWYAAHGLPGGKNGGSAAGRSRKS
ncbi:MAG TPA: hypothetical protein DCQ64_19985 [Candidatus Rokubacteria bacterium]|nr:hypothetical protein [Candidatus Rokubacteria bacterium]